MVFTGKRRVCETELVFFTHVFYYWFLWCKPGKLTEEWVTLETLLAEAGLLCPLKVICIRMKSLQPRAKPTTFQKKKNHLAYLAVRVRPGLLLHVQIWTENTKIPFQIILWKCGLYSRVEESLGFLWCYSYLHLLWERNKLTLQQVEFSALQMSLLSLTVFSSLFV